MIKRPNQRVYKRVNGKVIRVAEIKPDLMGLYGHKFNHDEKPALKDYLPDVNFYKPKKG